jgi:hypothetical protein
VKEREDATMAEDPTLVDESDDAESPLAAMAEGANAVSIVLIDTMATAADRDLLFFIINF